MVANTGAMSGLSLNDDDRTMVTEGSERPRLGEHSGAHPDGAPTRFFWPRMPGDHAIRATNGTNSSKCRRARPDKRRSEERLDHFAIGGLGISS